MLRYASESGYQTKQNYRPISNLAFVSKICEKTVAVQFTNHLRKNSLMEPFQSAYRANHNAETALLRVFNDILRSMDQQIVTILVLLDLSAAFDTVDHNILLHRLHTRFGASGTALDWFKDNLSNRRQRVSVDGSLLDPVQIKFGVPQGSVFGPLLFLAYISPLGDIIRRHGLDFHLYADDTQLYLSFDFVQSQMALDTIRAAIYDIKDWLLINMLKFNTSKTDLGVIGSHQQLSKLNLPLALHVEQSEIITEESITNHGVIMDQHQKLKWHVNNIFKVCTFHLRNISKIRRFLTTEACKLLIHALVTSRLDYCNSILYGFNQSILQRLQLLQNYAARLVYRIPKFCHISRTSTGCLCKQEFSSNYHLLYLNAYMELVLNICRSYSVEEGRALALDLLTPSNYTSQERNQGRNEAQQTLRFQFLDLNCGTSFQLPFRTAAALMFLNLDLKHFYSRIFFFLNI